MPYKYGFNAAGRVIVLKTGRYAPRKAARRFWAREYRKIFKIMEERRLAEAAKPRVVRMAFSTGVSADKQKGALKLEYMEVVRDGTPRSEVEAKGLGRLRVLMRRELNWRLYDFSVPEHFNWDDSEPMDAGMLGRWRARIVYKGRDYVEEG